jgi:tetratricopeptide (TPR) repeat protein
LPALEARALLELGFVNLQQGQYERAEAQLRQAQDYYHRMDNQFYLADIYFQLSAVAAEQNEVSVSFDYLKQMQQSVEKIGDRKGAGLAAHMLSNIYNPLGMYAEAIQASRQARQIAQEIGDTEFESFVLHMLCDSYRCVGSFDQASECGQQSLILARAHKSPLAIISAHHYLAILAMDNDELELARAHCLDAYALYQELDHKIGVVGILAVLAAVTLQLGRKVEAVAIVDDILARLDGKPVVGVDHPLRVYWYCYRVLRAASDARARDVLSSGYALMQTIAASITDPAMCRVFRDGVAVHRALAAAWHATQAAVADAAPMPSVYHNGANGSLMNNTIDE